MSLAHRLPLQIRLIATVAAALGITASLSVVPVYWHAKSKVATEMQAALAVGTRVALNEIQTSESASDLARRLDLMVAHFHGDRHLRASLVNEGGVAISASRLAPPDEQAPKWFAQFIDARPLTKIVALTAPLPPLMSVKIEADPTNEVAEAWQDLNTFAGILGLFCLLVLGLVTWAVARAIKPIQALLNGYSEIGAGNLTARVTPSGSPELERLCLGFNTMGGELQRMADRNARLTQQLEDVQEEERAELARDLHDEVSPLLFAADVDAAMISRLAAEAKHHDIATHTDAIRSALTQLKKIVTVILGQLRPAMLLDQGLHVAIDNFIESCRRRHPCVTFDVSVDDVGVKRADVGPLYFVAREAISNALRHARPGKVSLDLSHDDAGTITLRVCDDGGGPKDREIIRGFGMRGMEERIGALGGTLDVAHPADKPGLCIEAVIPNRAAPPAMIAADKPTRGPETDTPSGAHHERQPVT